MKASGMGIGQIYANASRKDRNKQWTSQTEQES